MIVQGSQNSVYLDGYGRVRRYADWWDALQNIGGANPAPDYVSASPAPTPANSGPLPGESLWGSTSVAPNALTPANDPLSVVSPTGSTGSSAGIKVINYTAGGSSPSPVTQAPGFKFKPIYLALGFIAVGAVVAIAKNGKKKR